MYEPDPSSARRPRADRNTRSLAGLASRSQWLLWMVGSDGHDDRESSHALYVSRRCVAIKRGIEEVSQAKPDAKTSFPHIHQHRRIKEDVNAAPIFPPRIWSMFTLFPPTRIS